MVHIVRALPWAAPLLAALVCAQPCRAQLDSWDRIKVIQPGRNISLKLHERKQVNGKMHEWRADGLTVRRGKNVISINKSEVEQVVIVIGRSRAKKALLAGSITGGAVGGLLGAAYASNNCCDISPAIVPGAAAAWGGIAAGIAALFPPHRELIYKAEESPAKQTAEK